jgi:hypothetical protein
MGKYKIGDVVFSVERIKPKKKEKFLVIVQRGTLSDEKWSLLQENLVKEHVDEDEEAEVSKTLWKVTISIDEILEEDDIVGCVTEAIDATFPGVVGGTSLPFDPKTFEIGTVEVDAPQDNRNKWYYFHALDQLVAFEIELGSTVDVNDPETTSILSDLVSTLIPGIKKLEIKEIEELSEDGTRIAWENVKHLFT